jgi:transcriptional regulator with XRE-family HTH domain
MGRPNRGGSFRAVMDAHVGARVREIRLARGLSRKALGEIIGISPHQQDKYEQGVDLIYPERLIDFSAVLDVPVDFFFEGFDGGYKLGASKKYQRLQQFARDINNITNERHREALNDAVRTLAIE